MICTLIDLDKEILVNVSQFPPSGVVDEGKPLTLSCEINRQSYRSPLKLEWRRNGDTAVDSQWLSDSIMPSYVYKKTAIPEDAGLYECVVTSKGAVIDTLKANQSVVINCKWVFHGKLSLHSYLCFRRSSHIILFRAIFEQNGRGTHSILCNQHLQLLR